MDKGFFQQLETSSAQERQQIADNLKRLYNRWYKEENETFAEMRTAKKGKEYNEAQRRYIAAVSKLGAVQAVFAELGIDLTDFMRGCKYAPSFFLP